MEKVMKGKAWKFGNNIDTDQIYPGIYVELTEMEDIKKHALSGSAEPKFADEVQPGDIVVAGTNFGCGSSREHAAMTLKGAGVGAVLAESFGRIFFRNAINLGLPVIVCPGISKCAQKGDEIRIDIETGEVTDVTRGKVLKTTLGKGILELVDVKSAPYPGASVVPEYCRATYDRRLLVGETKESVLAPIVALMDKLMADDPELKVKVSYAVGKEKCYTGETIEGERFFPGWLFDKDAEFVQAVKKELNERGYDPEITQYNFCTNGSHYAGEAGIQTFGLGPSRENLAHTVSEYVEVDSLAKVTDCYYGVLKALMK